MENDGFKRLFEKLGKEAGETRSAAQRLGEAILSLLGPVEGVSEDELVDALIAGFEERRSGSRTEAAEPVEEPAEAPAEGFPFKGEERTPVPMRTAGAGASPVDYGEMSLKQFNELKKLLKKANADGRRIKL